MAGLEIKGKLSVSVRISHATVGCGYDRADAPIGLYRWVVCVNSGFCTGLGIAVTLPGLWGHDPALRKGISPSGARKPGRITPSRLGVYIKLRSKLYA